MADIPNVTTIAPAPYSDISFFSKPADTGSASTGFVVWGAALVFLMAAGLGLFYSGLSRYNNALSLFMLCMLAVSVVTIQFFLFGFSLAFSSTGGPFIGDFRLGALTRFGDHAFPNTAPNIPSAAFMIFQMQFATLTAALIFGSVPERTRFVPAMIFVFLWTTVVYDFVAYWTWADRGWLRNLACLRGLGDLSVTPCFSGAYDFAGGGPVHISSGFSGLAYCMLIGKRRRIHEEHHNLINVFLGTTLLWFGWFAFNGGSAGASTTRAAMAALVTTICAATAGLAWCLFDYIFTRKLSALGYCSGVVAGLVAITPASGYVAPWVGLVFGVFSGVGLNAWTRLKKRMNFDDSFDAWSIHGVGGFMGNILTGIFAEQWIGQLDGTTLEGGWMDWHWIQILWQFIASCSIAAWSFVVSYILLFVINKIPGLHLRQTEENEDAGGDFGEMGELAYMLEITDAEAEPLPDVHVVGALKDGRLVSVREAYIPTRGDEARRSNGSIGDMSNGRRGAPNNNFGMVNVRPRRDTDLSQTQPPAYENKTHVL